MTWAGVTFSGASVFYQDCGRRVPAHRVEFGNPNQSIIEDLEDLDYDWMFDGEDETAERLRDTAK